jgi:hypothetical protein
VTISTNLWILFYFLTKGLLGLPGLYYGILVR